MWLVKACGCLIQFKYISLWMFGQLSSGCLIQVGCLIEVTTDTGLTVLCCWKAPCLEPEYECWFSAVSLIFGLGHAKTCLWAYVDSGGPDQTGCAVWSRPSLSANRIIGYYRMYEWHYENMPIQIHWKFHHKKFSGKNSDIFHISTQNIGCGCS